MDAVGLKNKAYDHVVEADYAPDCSLLNWAPPSGVLLGVAYH